MFIKGGDVTPFDFIILDGESTSLHPTAAITEIGMIAGIRTTNKDKDLVDYINNNGLCPTIKFRVDLFEQWIGGSDFDSSTQEWAIKLHKEKGLYKDKLPSLSITDSIESIKEFIHKHSDENTLIFCRHPHADWCWIEQMCRIINVKNPIKHNKIIDISSYLTGKLNRYTNYLEDDHTKNFTTHDCIGDVKKDLYHLLKVNQLGNVYDGNTDIVSTVTTCLSSL